MGLWETLKIQAISGINHKWRMCSGKQLLPVFPPFSSLKPWPLSPSCLGGSMPTMGIDLHFCSFPTYSSPLCSPWSALPPLPTSFLSPALKLCQVECTIERKISPLVPVSPTLSAATTFIAKIPKRKIWLPVFILYLSLSLLSAPFSNFYSPTLLAQIPWTSLLLRLKLYFPLLMEALIMIDVSLFPQRHPLQICPFSIFTAPIPP